MDYIYNMHRWHDDIYGFWMDGQVLSGYPPLALWEIVWPSARWIFSHRARRWRRGGSYGVLPLASLALAGWSFSSTLQTSFSTGDQWMVSGTLFFFSKPLGIGHEVYVKFPQLLALLTYLGSTIVPSVRVFFVLPSVIFFLFARKLTYHFFVTCILYVFVRICSPPMNLLN